jgi:hypothetical protein
MAQQINVFVENRPGRIKTVTDILASQSINIRAIVIQDRGGFGVMKILVNDPRKAQLALAAHGLASALRDIVAVPIDDRPGGLRGLLQVFDEGKVNILDAYGFVIDSGTRAVWCVEVDDVAAVEAAVRGHGFSPLADAELYEM